MQAFCVHFVCVFLFMTLHNTIEKTHTLCTCCNCFLSSCFLGPDATLHLIPLNGLPKGESQAASSAAAVKQDILPPPEGAVKSQDAETETSKFIKNNLTEEKDMEFMDAHEEGTQTEGGELY